MKDCGFMNNPPKVSVIMGVYNCKESVSNAIDSILAQTFSDWELIICDDGSTDGTDVVLQKYEAENPGKIICLRNEHNKKLAYSLNRCLMAAKGEYIARMDADDKSLPNRLQKQVKFLDGNPEYALVGGATEIFDGNSIIGIRIPKAIPDTRDVLFGPTFLHPTIMMRKYAYDILNGYTELERAEQVEDWDLWLRFFSFGFKGYNLQEPVLVYYEPIDDHKKRTFSRTLNCVKTARAGYAMLHISKWQYIFSYKPILMFFAPNWIRHCYRKYKMQKIR